jgi:hypothetical protein
MCCGCDLVLFSLQYCCPTSLLTVFIVLIEALLNVELQMGMNSDVICIGVLKYSCTVVTFKRGQ